MSVENTKSKFSSFQHEEQLQREGQQPKKSKSMTITSRLFLFVLAPTAAGFLGLSVSYFNSKFGRDNPEPIDFDRDFILPFLIALVLICVVSIQTQNFTSYEAKPLVSWPKVVKKKKIIRKTVIVDDNGNAIEDMDTQDLLDKLSKKED